MTGILSQCDQFRATVLLAYEYLIATVWVLYKWCVPTVWLVYDQHMARKLLLFVATILPEYGYHMTSK